MERRNRKEKKRTEIKLKMMILLSFSHLNEMQHKDNGVKREGKKKYWKYMLYINNNRTDSSQSSSGGGS